MEVEKVLSLASFSLSIHDIKALNRQNDWFVISFTTLKVDSVVFLNNYLTIIQLLSFIASITRYVQNGIQ